MIYIRFLLVFIAGGLAASLIIPHTGNQADSATSTPRGDRKQITAALADADNRIRALQEELESLRARLREAESENTSLVAENRSLTERIATIEEEVDSLNQEWTFSYGTTREAGKFVGRMLRDAADMRNLDPDDPEALVRVRDLFLQFTSMGPILQEMQEIDDKPAEFAQFRAAALGSLLDLDEGTEKQVGGIVERYKAMSLELEEGSEERADLNTRALDEIRQIITPEQREILDGVPAQGMGAGFSDLLETPSLDPQRWRERMERGGGR